MKSDKRNDLLPRDAALARLLAEALESKAAEDAQSSACPDSEVLAAYAEHGLSDREASRWEGHIADCSRCQKIIAGVVIGGENLEEARNKEAGKLGAGVRDSQTDTAAGRAGDFAMAKTLALVGARFGVSSSCGAVVRVAPWDIASASVARCCDDWNISRQRPGKSVRVFHKAGRNTDGSSEGAATTGRHIRGRNSRFGRAASKLKPPTR